MGMSFLLDAEQFNYGYQEEYGVGFKMALHDHRDKPMLKLSSELINIGTITQINVKPEITYTTKSAIEMFAPDEIGVDQLLYFCKSKLAYIREEQ